MTAPIEVTAALAARCVTAPRADDHKYRRGVVEFRTGSVAFPGAAVLGVEGAAGAGAGFVRYVGPDAVASRVLDARPETVCLAGDAQVVVTGSGVGDAAGDERVTAALERAREGGAVVLDAGALELVTADDHGLSRAVLTPHAGELAGLASRVLGRPLAVRDVEADPVGVAAAVAEATGATVLCKGHRTFAVSADERYAVTAPTSWMAVAGTGDVLAGVVGALLATAARRHDGLERTPAAVAAAGAWIHGRAAWLAARRRLDPATSATDVLDDARSLAGGAPGGPITALGLARTVPDAVAAVLVS